jgi:hypothetical protein
MRAPTPCPPEVHVPEHDTLGALQRLYPRLGYPEPAEALRWVRKMSGGAAVQDSMVLSEAEQREGLPECVFWRCVAVDAQVRDPMLDGLGFSTLPHPLQ